MTTEQISEPHGSAETKTPTGSTPQAPQPSSGAVKAKPNGADAIKRVSELLQGQPIMDEVAGEVEAKPARADRPKDPPERAPERVERGQEREVSDEAPQGLLSGDAVSRGAISATTLSELSEQIGMKPEDLYKITVGVGDDGQQVSLSELKDTYQNQAATVRESAKREHAIRERETALGQAEREFESLLGDLAQHMPPEQAERVRAQRQQKMRAHQRREVDAMLRAHPDFKDPVAFQGFQSDAVKHLGAYGFKAGEIEIQDHRLVTLLRDWLKDRQTLERLMAFEPEVSKPQPRRGSRKPSQGRKAEKPGPRSPGDQVAAVRALIEGR